MRPAVLVRELERIRDLRNGDAAARKELLVQAAVRTTMPGPRLVVRLHEAACFLRAYPDDARVLAAVERLLESFESRRDVKRFRRALADSGIAATDLHDRFYWFTVRWLAERWPHRLRIDWPAFANRADLEPMLRLLIPAAEAGALDDIERTPRQWIDLWRAPGEADAAFLVRRFAALRADPFATEFLYERLDPPLVLQGDAGSDPPAPSRTTARAAGVPAVFRTQAFERKRPDLRAASRKPPLAVRDVPEHEAAGLLDLARAAMITRNRDLDSFEHADLHDFRMVDCGDGLRFVCIGLVPERRALLDVIYGYLTLQSGVPVGYVLSTALFRSAFVAYNVFDTFRRAAAAATYARVLGMVRALFGATSFAIDPYQLGHDNAEGQKSGAWWFYYKLGFRPVEPVVQSRVAAELQNMRRDPRHRSSRATLQALSAAPLFLHAGRARADILGRIALGNVSLHVSQALSVQGADRESAIDAAVTRVARRLQVRAPKPGAGARRLAWELWAPLVEVLPGLERWPGSERAGLARVIDAKGGRRESDFAMLFDSHVRLRQAVRALAQQPPEVDVHAPAPARARPKG